MFTVRRFSVVVLSAALAFGVTACGGSSATNPSVAAPTKVTATALASPADVAIRDAFLKAIITDQVAGKGFAARTPDSLVQLGHVVADSLRTGASSDSIVATMAPNLSNTATVPEIRSFVVAAAVAFYPEWISK